MVDEMDPTSMRFFATPFHVSEQTSRRLYKLGRRFMRLHPICNARPDGALHLMK